MDRKIDIKSLISHLVREDGFNKCRICLGDTSEGLVYLSDTIIKDEEKEISLAQMIGSLANTEICELADYPKGICIICVKEAIAAYKFRTLVTDSSKIWSAMIENLFSLPIPKTKVDSMAIIINQKLPLKILNIEYRKSKARNIKTKLKRPRKKYKKSNNGLVLKCEDCDKEFHTPLSLSKHLKNNTTKCSCPICGLVFQRGSHNYCLSQHIKEKHTKKSNLCNLCFYISMDSADFKSHRKTHKASRFHCGECWRTFDNALSLEVHSQRHLIRTCIKCNRQFANLSCYSHHKTVCQIDTKSEIDMSNSRKSNGKQSNVKFACDYCDKTYNNRPQLKNHILWIHMKVSPYQCQACGKQFHTINRLTEHNIVHTRERNFSCDLCGLKLVSKMALVHHRRRHTGEKPYVCECGDAFISSSRRLEHQKRRHGKGQRVPCIQCNASFVRKIELKRHVQKAHDAKMTYLLMEQTKIGLTDNG